MENTLKQTEQSQFTACHIEREPDGTLLFRYVQAPAPWKKRLYIMFSFGLGLVAFFFTLFGLVSLFADGKLGGIPMAGVGVFIFWFVFSWVPKKWAFGSHGYGTGELRIVPDVGFKLSNGNLPFKDVQKFINGLDIHTGSYDIRAVTSSGTHTIARCATDIGLEALVISLQKEGVIGD